MAFKQRCGRYFVLATILLLPCAQTARTASAAAADGPNDAGHPAVNHGNEIVYEDASATSSANVIQVLPNGHQENTTLTAVERISVRQDVMVVQWAHGAVTLLPRQYVLSITINKRVAQAATQAENGKP